ncbi:decapping nuclease DXO homolog [Lucilia cuprina]|uniref:decapping nuclease DXO homolog n=1 Tax=Lucilia cuprina TaxID=7375 RepID=UPI001F05EA51|nr:decapping nuclease DXO homolog [Lucilia cuprina]
MNNSSNKQYNNDLGIRIRPPNSELPFPDIKKPQPIGFYSINANRDFEPNDQQLRYFKLPNVNKLPLDLNAGLDIAIKKPESANDETLDSLLKFIYDHHHRIFGQANGAPPPPPPEFVTWRGILRLIMCTPYEYRQDWCLHVTRFNNTFYLLKRETAQDKYRRSQETEQQKTFMAYGFKFEQYCLSESPFKEPDTTAPVNENEEFTLVFQTRLAGLSLLYGAEMDGIVSDQPVQLNYDKPNNLDTLKYVELKVRQRNLNAFQYKSFLQHKTRNWWCQSFLVGIQDLYVGMRNEKGFVHDIERMEMRSLPKLGGQTHWAPWVCANFLLQFLLRLRSIMSNENCPHTVYEFYFNAKTGHITFECFRGKTPYSFIPDWYINLINRA